MIKSTPKTMETEAGIYTIGHHQWTFDIEPESGSSFPKVEGCDKIEMELFVRQSSGDDDDFTVGIRVICDGIDFNLSRYNGSNHPHSEMISYVCHIHNATVDSINKFLVERAEAKSQSRRGLSRPEQADVKATGRYKTREEAGPCLFKDYNIEVLEYNLFNNLIFP